MSTGFIWTVSQLSRFWDNHLRHCQPCSTVYYFYRPDGKCLKEKIQEIPKHRWEYIDYTEYDQKKSTPYKILFLLELEILNAERKDGEKVGTYIMNH